MSASNHQTIKISQAQWPRDVDDLRLIRNEVFVKEQAVPVELEWDGHDAECLHVLAFADATPVATGRLQADGKIGRMAVRQPWRGLGVGTQVLEALIQLADTIDLNEVYLHAQSHAVGFYSQHNFVQIGDPFEEAGIPHCAMRRTMN